MLGQGSTPLNKACSWIRLEGFVAWKALARFVVPLHVDVVGTHCVGKIVAVVVGEAGVPQGDDFPDRVVAATALRDADVAGLAPAGPEECVARAPAREGQSPRPGVQPRVDRLGGADRVGELLAVVVSDTRVGEM